MNMHVEHCAPYYHHQAEVSDHFHVSHIQTAPDIPEIGRWIHPGASLVWLMETNMTTAAKNRSQIHIHFLPNV
jgi:hypothetical protein